MSPDANSRKRVSKGKVLQICSIVSEVFQMTVVLFRSKKPCRKYKILQQPPLFISADGMIL